MRISRLARLSVQVAILAIASFAPATQARTTESSRALPSGPLDALPSDPLLSQDPLLGHDHAGWHSSDIPGNPPSLQLHRSGRNSKTHGSTAGGVNCTGNTPSTSNVGLHDRGGHNRGGHQRPAASPPIATPCPSSDPPSTGINCVENAPVESTPVVLITPPVTPPISNAGRHNETRHGRKQVPPPPTTTTTAATTATTTTLPCPSSDPGSGSADNSNGLTDVIVIADPLVPHQPHNRPRSVPEPGTLGLLALGLSGLALLRRRAEKR
jgi:hypothetical protein